MKKFFTLLFSIILTASSFAQVPGACVTGGKGGVVPLDGNADIGTNGATYNKSDCGLNFVHADKLIETRFNQYTTAGNLGSGLPTTLTISGLPNCLTIDKAYVYYWVSYLTATPPVTSVDLTNPTPTTGNYPAVMIGQDQGKCWGETGTANYRADVTAAIAGNGNYGLNIQGLTGAPQGNFANNYDMVDGASLIIIYKDNSATYQGSLILWDGNMTGVGNTYTKTMTGINACAAGTNAVAFNLVSDMQDNVGPSHPATLNGVVSSQPNVFWCWDQSNTTVTAAQATAVFGEDGQGSDCFDWGLMGLYYQTTTCTTCTPSAVSLTVTPTPSTCNAPNGSATATATTSNPPLTYSWSTGATTTSISNLSAGTYTCIVTSASGCSTVQTFTITTSAGPAVTFTSTPTMCAGSSNGSATLTASGGSAPYTYAWVTTPVQTTVTATGLSAGTYSVMVGDASGCSATYTVAVTSPTALAATTTSTPTQCTANIGTATATGSGGTSPYTYSWATTPVQNAQTATGLAVGNYNVTVTDANGCTTTTSVAVNSQSPTLTSTASVINNASCFQSTDGSAIVNPTGGTGPFTYSWTPISQNTQTVSGLSMGTYNVTVTDANGCTSSSSVNITQPTAVALTSSSTTASCGISDGTATVAATGGTGPYSYLWLTTPVQTSPTLNNVPLGTYNVLVTDANGCTGALSVAVPGFGPPSAEFDNSPDTVNLLDATVYFMDLSTNAYTWNWNFGDPNNATGSTAQNPLHIYSDTGTYCITLIVTDPDGVCRDTATHCLKVEPIYTFYAPNCFTPNSDGFNEFFTGYGSYIKEYDMWLFDRWGNLIWSCHTMGEPQIDKKCSWDGKVRKNGNTVQEDVYVWKVLIKDLHDKEHKYIGHVSIVK